MRHSVHRLKIMWKKCLRQGMVTSYHQGYHPLMKAERFSAERFCQKIREHFPYNLVTIP